MTGAVSAYTAPSSAVSAHTAPAAGSQSTASVRFDQAVLEFADLPVEARRLAPDHGVLAEVVVAIPGVVIRNGIALQERQAFRAYPTQILIITVSRQLVKRGDGKYSPDGPWNLTSSQTLTTVSGVRAARRRGTIAPGTLTDAIASTGRPPPSREHIDAVATEVYLPASVRATVAHEVPRPEAHIGELTRWEKRPGAATQQVVVLRHGGATAVVVKATRRDRPDFPWEVTRYAYQLETGSKALSR
jgi:hypothetical protein